MTNVFLPGRGSKLVVCELCAVVPWRGRAAPLSAAPSNRPFLFQRQRGHQPLLSAKPGLRRSQHHVVRAFNLLSLPLLSSELVQINERCSFMLLQTAGHVHTADMTSRKNFKGLTLPPTVNENASADSR